MNPAGSTAFAALVRRRFAYLETDHGFGSRLIDSGYVRFEHPEIEFNVLWGRWELDAFMQVHREDAVFRPYKSRQFDLYEVLRVVAPTALDSRPDLPSQVKTIEDVDCHLRWAAPLMQHGPKACGGACPDSCPARLGRAPSIG